MQLEGLSKLIAETAIRLGVMQKGSLLEGQKFGSLRNPIARTPGFRKYVNATMINARMNDTTRKNTLLGHSIALDDAHYKRKEDDLLQEYLKVVDVLTINEVAPLTSQ